MSSAAARPRAAPGVSHPLPARLHRAADLGRVPAAVPAVATEARGVAQEGDRAERERGDRAAARLPAAERRVRLLAGRIRRGEQLRHPRRVVDQLRRPFPGRGGQARLQRPGVDAVRLAALPETGGAGVDRGQRDADPRPGVSPVYARSSEPARDRRDEPPARDAQPASAARWMLAAAYKLAGMGEAAGDIVRNDRIDHGAAPDAPRLAAAIRRSC